MTISDPLTEKIEARKLVKRREIINEINRVINEPWEQKCREKGKKVYLLSSWKQVVRELNICEDYRKKGWYVFHIADGPVEEYILIRHPKYYSYNRA
jgi:hypothetical protein